MMRYALALTIAMMALPASARPVTLATIDEAAKVRCQTFIASYESDAFYTRIAPDITEWIGRRDGLTTVLNSECVIMELTRAECLAHPRTTVGEAVNSLFKKDRAGMKLPDTRRCGA